MPAGMLSNPSNAPAGRPLGGYNSVPLLLAVLSAVALLGLPWLSTAPNRLVSGESLWLLPLLHGAWALPAGGVLAVLFIMVGLTVPTPRRRRLLALLALTMSLAPGAVWLAGAQAGVAAQTASSVARTSLGSGFWVLCGFQALLLAEVLRLLRATPAVRVLAGLTTAGLISALLVTGACDDLSIMKEFANRADVFWLALGRHAVIVAVSLGFTLAIGLPLGALGHERPAIHKVLMPVLNVLQTIPSIALFGLLMSPLAWLGAAVPVLQQVGVSGVGLVPAAVALTLYGLLPVVRGVLTGLAEVPAGVMQAARSIGMSNRQSLFWVALPLALPVIMAGMRTAAVQLVGLAAVAALIGAGGLGAIMFEGLFSASQDVVLLAVLPIVGMGVLVDGVFSGFGRMTRVARARFIVESAERAV